MASQVAARRIRWGVLCLPLAGLVGLESLVVSGEYILASEDLRGFAEQVTSARFQSSLLIDHLHVLLLLVGSFALYAYLARSRAARCRRRQARVFRGVPLSGSEPLRVARVLLEILFGVVGKR